MSYFEKDAIISGIGISRIGRRTGIPGLDLTMESVRAAIDDAGLAPSDIDGIATLGDTPAAEVNAALQIDAANCGTGFSTGGLLNPVISSCRAVSEGHARHVIIYRTIQMLGGTVPVKPDDDGADVRHAGRRDATRRRPDGRCQRSGCRASVFRGQLAGIALSPSHGVVRNHQRAAGLAGDQQPA